MDKDKVIAKFEGDSPFTFFIELAKASKDEHDGMKWIVTGVASTTNVDHDQERMSAPALAQMANIINEKSVPLRYEHDKDPKSIIGKVYEATIDAAKKLVIKAELDQSNTTAKALWDGLQTGSKLGLSVGGKVKRAFRELAEGVGKVIKTFYDVELEEVSVTPRPANYDAWLIDHAFAKSYNDTPEFYNDFRFYNKFLIDNPQLDYIAVFEKSINDKWVKVDSNNSQNKQMKITKETPSSSGDKVISTSDLTGTIDSTHKETEETTTEEKTNTKENEPKVSSEVSSTEGLATKSYVDSKFAELTGLLKQISKSLTYNSSDIHALDSENPDQPKDESTQMHAKDRVKAELEEPMKTHGSSSSSSSSESESEGKEKEREGQDNTYADGTSGDKAPVEDSVPHQQHNPDETAVTTEQQQAKDRKKGVDQAGAERQRGEAPISSLETSGETALDSEMPTSSKVNTEENKAKDGNETNGHDEDETMKTGSESESDTTSGTTSETGTETNKYGHDYMMPELGKIMAKARASNTDPMGVFVFYVTKALEEIKDELKNTNKRVLGLEPRFAEMIRTNPDIQKSIKEWMTPGKRQGMAVNAGRPVLVTREGGRYELMAKEVGADLKKSVEGKDFKSLYQKEFSSGGRIGE
jgi:HK97 family phage prohead protease